MSEEGQSQFRVRIEPEGFEKRRLVFGPIWMEAGGWSFPGTGWTDFPVVILGFWLSNIQAIVERREKTYTLPFMDGPYSATVEATSTDEWPLSTDEWTLRFLKRGAHREDVVFTTKVDASRFLDEVCRAAETVVEVCKKKEWIDDDLRTLESALSTTKRRRTI